MAGRVTLELKTSLTSTEKHFQFSGDLVAYYNGTVLKELSWVQSVPRKLV